ncbi:MAG: EamA family transporter [Desulfovibrionaceae bacterium]|nr:EamA family transporter [Desulfovibrionaceae bacterium]
MLNRREWALVGITVIWGLTFLLVRNVLSVSGPLFFVGFRFAVATLILSVISFKVISQITRTELVAGSLIGASLFIGYALQTYGLQYISASKSAFITAFYVPAVPLVQWLLMRKSPPFFAWLGIFFAFIGLILLSGPDNISPGFGKGELATFIGALVMAWEIVLISVFAGKISVRRVCIVQVAVTSFLAFLCMPVTGEDIPEFSWLLVLSALALGSISALVQFVMNWAQKTVSPTRATVIYSGEPIWAGIFGRLAGERLPAIALLGGVLVVLGVLVSGLKSNKKEQV